MSFGLSFLLGGVQAYNEKVDAKAAEEAKKAEQARALEMERLKQEEQTKRKLAEVSLTQSIDASNTSASYAINVQEAEKWNTEHANTPGAKRAVATMDGLEFIDVVPKSEKDKKPYEANRLSPVKSLLPNDKHDAIIYPLNGDMNAYQEQIRTAESDDDLPVLGEDFVAFSYPTSGGAGDTRADRGLREATDFLFRDGNLDKFITMAENGNSAPLDKAVKDLQMFWRNYSTTEQARMKIDENAYVVQTIFDYDPQYMSELAARHPKFFDEVVVSTVSDAVDMTANEIRQMNGLPTNGPVDVDPETLQVTVDVEEYNALGWAVEDGAYSGEFKNAVLDISESAGMTQSEVFKTFNSLGTQGSQELLKTYQDTQKWYAENTPYVLQDGQPVLRMSNVVPPQADKINTLLANFDNDPEKKHDLLTAMMSNSIIDKLPGKIRGGKSPAQQLISNNVTGDDVQDHVNRVRSSTNIVNQVDLLLNLVEEHGVEGGLSAEVMMTVPGLVNQFEAILDSVNLQPFGGDYTPMNPQLDMEARKEFEDLRRDAKASVRSGNVDAEKMYKAVSRALMYNVASMLQGGDFRNISDYDVRLAGERMAGIMGMLVDLESSTPALRQLREEAAFIKTVSDGYASGNLAEIAASSYLFNQRGSIRMTADAFISKEFGNNAGNPKNSPVVLPSEQTTTADPNIRRTPIDPNVPVVR